jgi:MYXO-CTERM domain-containing protein
VRTSFLLLIAAACGPGRGDQRFEARAVDQLVRAPHTDAITLRAARHEGILAPATYLAGAPDFRPPDTLRVWRKSKDRASSSCEGRVDEIEVEDYVKGVLPKEWVSSWEPASLEAGAIAIRTYAVWWAAAGGKYACADIDDTTASQVYAEGGNPLTDAAVDRTRGMYAILDGSLIFTEYSAENGGTTDFGVADSPCAGKTRNGHGRGMCQWGSQRWASAGKDAAWILSHYYPGAEILYGHDAVLADEGFPAELEAGQTAEVYLELLNVGTATWWPDEVRLELTDDSPLFDEASWPDPQHPATVSAATDAGDAGLFAWTLRAPDVRRPIEVVLDLSLVDERGVPFGETVSWPIRVVPEGQGTAAGELADRGLPTFELVSDTAAPSGWGCGCRTGAPPALWLGWLAVFALRRRRTG